MNTFYTVERNTQIVLSLMKAHGIKKVVASPGTTNLRLVASMQQDSFFDVYSAADERSAAYMACGLAAETNEPVALSCTGATASRNYLPGLTEAFYRKLPILAITSMYHRGRIGQNIPQVIDRSVQMNDTVKLSVELTTVHSEEDNWECMVQANRAMLELKRNGGGPVHINLETEYSMDFSVKELPPVNVIRRVTSMDKMPEIVKGRVCVFVGAHKEWTEAQIHALDNFCESYNAVVLCDHTSNYKGKYGSLFSIVTSQTEYKSPCKEIDLMIHIGDISGAYPNFDVKNVWRVNPDGEVRDTFKKLKYIFEMEEERFFDDYAALIKEKQENTQIKEWVTERERLQRKVPKLPFSNLWLASQTASKLPDNSSLHLGILNSLRSWNFFELPKKVRAFSNTGGFGIDGSMSSMIGASLGNPNKLYFLVIGDLAFFYDMNVLGNRHVGSNLRILLVNNGVGTEFKNHSHQASKLGELVDDYIAAKGHYGNKSHVLVKHYSQDLGFKYMAARTKEEYLDHLEDFLSPELTDSPILFEVFTDSKDESDALKLMNTLETSVSDVAKQRAKQIVKSVAGENTVRKLKKMIGK